MFLRLNDVALRGTGKPTSELRDITCHMGSQCYLPYPTQVNASRLTPARKAGTRLTFPAYGWKAELGDWLHTHRDGLPAHRRVTHGPDDIQQRAKIEVTGIG